MPYHPSNTPGRAVFSIFEEFAVWLKFSAEVADNGGSQRAGRMASPAVGPQGRPSLSMAAPSVSPYNARSYGIRERCEADFRGSKLFDNKDLCDTGLPRGAGHWGLKVPVAGSIAAVESVECS